MTSVVRPATALDDSNGPPPPPEEAQADVEMQPATNDKLTQMKSELERLLQLQREWTETQHRKLQQKRELEQLLESHVLQVAVSTPAEAKDTECEARESAVAAAPAAEHDEQKHILARKEELRQLQEQATTVAKVSTRYTIDISSNCGVCIVVLTVACISEQKQQQTASALARKLEQLNADSAAIATANVSTVAASDASTSAVLPAKRKLDDAEATGSGARVLKKIATLPVPAKLHEFSRTPESLTASPDCEHAALFRIALRHLLQTGQERVSLLNRDTAFSCHSSHRRRRQCLQFKASLAGSLEVKALRWQLSVRVKMLVFVFVGRLVAFIDLEKQVIERACASILQDSRGDLPQAQRVQEAFHQSTLFANLFGSSNNISSDVVASTPLSSIYHALSDTIGNSSSVLRSAQCRRLRYHRFRQFSELLLEMEAWLFKSKAKSTEEDDLLPGGISVIQKRLQPANASSATITSKKPFDLEQDSVFRQVRSFLAVGVKRKPRKRKKLDPMNMLCMYELSGVCNDENCPYQHQKDFDEVSPSDGDDHNDESKENDEPRVSEAQQASQLLSKEQIALLQDFAHLRSKVMRKWPVITGLRAASETTPSSRPTDENMQKLPAGVKELVHERTDTVNDDGDDGSSFLQLEDASEAMNLDLTNASISGSGSSRYCEADELTGLSVKALEEKIARNPEDTDSWLLLAINQLDFEVKLSDDATRISDSARLLGQLMSIYRCLHLSAFTTSSVVLDESKLKLSLHILSRALEIEANAYCEALWLLYLHLSSLLPKRDFDSEFEMTEQAMHLIPSSHRLWVHYMVVGKLDSIQLSEALHSRVLSHVSKPGSFQESQDDDKKPNLSGLLTALVLHLCIRLRSAGSSLRAIELLAALLRMPKPKETIMNDKQPESGSDLDWCEVVYHQLSWSDLATLSLVYAHLLLFNEIPAHIQKWLRVSGGDQQIQISAFGFAGGTFARDRCALEDLSLEDLKAAVDVYEITLHAVGERDENDHSKASDFLEVILNNSMIMLAVLDTQQEDQSQATAFDDFLNSKRNMLLQFPSASFTAATLAFARVGDNSSKSSVLATYEPLTDMLHASSVKRFPEGLHYYLCALRVFSVPPAIPALEGANLDVCGLLTRLSESLDGVNHEAFAKSTAEIKSATNVFERTKALKKLLHGLLSAWMDQLAAVNRQTEKQQLQSDPTTSGTSSAGAAVNIYVMLDICELMSMLLERSVAIDALDLVLRSSKFKHLSTESRQLAWTLRFIMQVDVFMLAKSTSMSPSMRGDLLQLFRRYMESMNMVSESVMQATDRISKAVDHQGIQSAIFECLYPQRSPYLLLEDNMCIFELCAAALPEFERASFYSSYHYWLSPSPRFCLGYTGIATHHWEWRKIRQGLRRCLSDSSTHDMALRALVALELKNQNVKGVARILEEEITVDPLSMEAWRLVLGMEILFGERGSTGASSSSLRATNLVTEITKRKLTVRANLYNDMELLDISKGSQREAKQRFLRSQESGDFHAWSIHRVPNAILMMDNLKSLDLSGNFLVEIPEAISRLAMLEVLNVSQNALVSVPTSLAKLSDLRVLNVSHNNLSALPGTLWVHLLKLQEMNLSANMITHLPAPPLSRLTDLRILQIGNNLLSNENMTQIRQLLAPKCAVSEVFSTKTSVENETKSAAKDEFQGGQTASDDTQAETIDESIGRPKSSKKDAMIVDEEQRKPDARAGEDGEDVMSLEDGEIGAFENDEGQSDAQQQSAESQNEQIISDSAATTAEVEDQANGHVEEQTSAAEAMSGGYELVTLSSEDQQHQPSPSTTEVVTAIATTELTNGELTPGEVGICNATDLTDKFEAYINENHVSRAQVKQRNPALWRKYVESQLHLHTGLGCCVMCDLPNEGWNQRFNTMVLCPSCLRVAVEMLQVHAQTSSIEPGLEELKEDH